MTTAAPQRPARRPRAPRLRIAPGNTLTDWRMAREFCMRPPRFNSHVVELDNAVVWPQTRFHHPDGERIVLHDGGVFRASGAICLAGVNAYSGGVHFPEKTPLDMPVQRLEGTWLFGGYIRTHFGNFVLNCLGRLWALDVVDESRLAGVIFIHVAGNVGDDPGKLRAAAAQVARLGHVAGMVALLSGGKPLHVVADPLEVERLIVPTSISGSLVLGGHATFRRMCERLHRVADAQAAAAAPRGARGLLEGLRARLLGPRERRLYVSRSRLPPHMAQFLLEQALEDNLRRNGYVIMHPQEMTLAEQLVAYRQADRILIAEGSAAHLLAMVARPDQHVGVIQRRVGSTRFTDQLRAFGVKDARTLAVMAGRVVPKDEALQGSQKVNVSAPAVLDFARLRDDLAGLGYIAPRRWRVPEAAEFQAALQAYAAARRAAPGPVKADEYVMVPVG